MIIITGNAAFDALALAALREMTGLEV